VTIDGVWIGNRIYCTLQPIKTESLWTLYSWQLSISILQPPQRFSRALFSAGPRTSCRPNYSLKTDLLNSSEIYDLWTDCREDTAFGIVDCLAVTRKLLPSGLLRARYQATSGPRRARHNMYSYYRKYLPSTSIFPTPHSLHQHQSQNDHCISLRYRLCCIHNVWFIFQTQTLAFILFLLACVQNDMWEKSQQRSKQSCGVFVIEFTRVNTADSSKQIRNTLC
jgi:hypothetical protein